MCILDLNKTLMYDFRYNYIKKKYNELAKLLFTDTDSLTYEIETEDAYKDFWSDKDKFDNSEYPEKSSYLDNQIEKLLESSKMKHQEFQKNNVKETLTLNYNYIKKKYNDKAKLLFTYTDSLTYKIETEDAYKDFWSDKDKFDNSEYPEKSSYLDNQIEKLLESSKMKHQEFQLMSS